MPSRRKTTSADAAIVGIHPRVEAKLLPGTTPLERKLAG
jgi:hypothetical protein